MARSLTQSFLAPAVLAGMLFAGTAAAQQPQIGGTVRIYQRDNPASASIHEKATYSTNVPFMAVFNNLVIFDQHVAQNSEASIVPELATSWTWNADKTKLTFKLRDGVKWHDGKPFTAADANQRDQLSAQEQYLGLTGCPRAEQ